MKNKLNPKKRHRNKKRCPGWFNQAKTLLTDAQKQLLESIGVKYRDVFVKNNSCIRMNMECKVILKPSVKKLFIANIYQNHANRNTSFIDLRPMHKLGILMLFPSSKYLNPTFF